MDRSDPALCAVVFANFGASWITVCVVVRVGGLHVQRGGRSQSLSYHGRGRGVQGGVTQTQAAEHNPHRCTDSDASCDRQLRRFEGRGAAAGREPWESSNPDAHRRCGEARGSPAERSARHAHHGVSHGCGCSSAWRSAGAHHKGASATHARRHAFLGPTCDFAPCGCAAALASVVACRSNHRCIFIAVARRRERWPGSPSGVAREL